LREQGNRRPGKIFKSKGGAGITVANVYGNFLDVRKAE